MDMQNKVNFCGVCEDISNSGKQLCMKFFRKTRLEKLHILIEWPPHLISMYKIAKRALSYRPQPPRRRKSV